MQHIKRVFCALAVLLAMAPSVFSGFGAVYADEVPTYRLGVTPTQDNLGKIEPGKTYTSTFKVKNTGREAFRYRIGFSAYAVEGDNYEPVYDKPSSYIEISDWITVSKATGELESGKEDEITYKINVPEDAHGGSQSAVIVVEMLNPDSDKNSTAVETVQQVGYLVFGNVDGDTTRTANILENKIPSFIFDPPIVATSVVENTGNVYTNASYTLQVFPLFGNEEIYTTEENPELKVIFPETKRYSEVAWEGAPALGIFRVKQTIKIFDEVSEVEKLVFLCPLWFIAIILLLIFLIIFWIVSRIRGRKE